MWLILAALSCLPAIAHARDDLPADAGADVADGQGGGIIITGTRSQATPDAEPYSIAVIDLARLERVLPRTVPEALSELPGVLVQKTGSGHGSPYIRGFTGNRTLLVIDGVRYNNATYRDGANEYFAQVDSFTLSQIELIAGPSSSLYGSEAVGGVLNLSTRSSGVLDQSGSYVGGEQIARFSSGDGSFVSRSAIELGSGGEWGVRAGATLRDYGNIRAADLGRLPYTGYAESAFDVRSDVVLGPSWLATVSHQSLSQKGVPRTHSTVFSREFAGTTRGTDLLREKDHERGLTYLKLKGALGTPLIETLEATLSYQSRVEAERRTRGDGVQIDQSFGSDLSAFNLVATSSLGRTTLTYGLDLSTEQIDSGRIDSDPASGQSISRIQGPVGDDARYDQAGLFLRGSHALSDSLSIEASARASWIDMSIGAFADPITGSPMSFDDGWSNLSGSIRGLWRQDAHALWAGYSRSFRAPNVADVSRFGSSRSSEIEVASLSLNPETFDTFEIAYRYRANGVQAGLSGYTTALNGYIATVPTGRMRDGLTEVAKRNAASGTISGIELSLEADLGDGFGISGNASWIRGRLTTPTGAGEVEEPISRIQPLVVNLALSWESAAIWAIAELQWADRADELSSGDLLDTQRIPPEGTPGYALVNLRGGAQITEGLAVTLALNNLLDEAYRTHGSGNNEAGRHMMLGLRLSF